MADKLVLMGAKHFLEMPTGTIYQSWWCENENELERIIQDFKKGKLELFYDRLEMYYNNSYSYTFDYLDLNNEDDNGDFPLIDINIVGDANPQLTLYLVLDEDTIKKLPNANKLLTKREDFIDVIIKEGDKELDNSKDPVNEWARKELEEDVSKPDGKYIDFYCENGGVVWR